MFAYIPLRRSLFSTPRLIALAVIMAVGLAFVSGASLVVAQRGGPGASSPDSYQGCVNTYTGVLRIVDEGRSCESHETSIELSSSAGNAALLSRIEALETENDNLQMQVATALAHTIDCLSAEGNEVYFTGCNVNIRDGSGDTYGAVNGLGNLIIGYNEDLGNSRTGSHNLVVGARHSYSSYGGLVAGYQNTISGGYSSVSGGYANTASGNRSSVSGGYENIASGPTSSVSGGHKNVANGTASSVSGGSRNFASGPTSSVSGGADNHATGTDSHVSGGIDNLASGLYSSIGGGGHLEASTTPEFLP